MTFPEKIFIDDSRKPVHVYGDDQNWQLISSYNEFENYINSIIASTDENNMPKEISFDYDLGYNHSGIQCAELLINVCIKYGSKMPKCYVHSGYVGIFMEFEELFITKWKQVTGEDFELWNNSAGFGTFS